MPATKTISRRKIKELHSQGRNDLQIAQELRCSVQYVGRLRRLMRLPPHGRHGTGWHSWSEQDRSVLTQGIATGLTYHEIGRQLNRSTISVRRASQRWGLVGDTRYRNPADRQARAWDLMKKGVQPQAVAEQLGLSLTTVKRYKRVMPTDW